MARGDQFCLGAHAARVLGNDMTNGMVAQKGDVAVNCEGAGVNHRLGMRQGQRPFGRIDQPQQVMVLGFGGKSGQPLLANRQKHPRGGFWQSRDSGYGIGNMGPTVPGLCDPRGTLEHQKRNAGHLAGRYRIQAHLGGKGVGGVDHSADALGLQIVQQPFHSAKAANAGRQGLRFGRIGAPGVGEYRVQPRLGAGSGQLAGFGRTAKDQDACHG